MEDSAYMDRKAILERFEISARTLQLWVQQGAFPQPDTYRSSNRPLWLSTTVAAWLLQRGQAMRKIVGEPLAIQMLDRHAVAKALSIGVRKLDRLRAAGLFPKPDLQIGPELRWKQSTVNRWIERAGRPK